MKVNDLIKILETMEDKEIIISMNPKEKDPEFRYFGGIFEVVESDCEVILISDGEGND